MRASTLCLRRWQRATISASHTASTGHRREGRWCIPAPMCCWKLPGLAPGSYVATAQLTHGKSSTPIATCTAPFQLKPPPSLTVQCSADPASIQDGDATTITAVGASGGNRKLVYSFTTQCRADSPQRNDSAAAVRRRGDDNRYVPGEGRSWANGGSDDGSEREDGGPEAPAAPATPPVVHDWATSSSSDTDASSTHCRGPAAACMGRRTARPRRS